jgi:hypothetical protein
MSEANSTFAHNQAIVHSKIQHTKLLHKGETKGTPCLKKQSNVITKPDRYYCDLAN